MRRHLTVLWPRFFSVDANELNRMANIPKANARGKTKTQKRKRKVKDEMLSTEMLRFLSAECPPVSLGALLITFCGLASVFLLSPNYAFVRYCAKKWRETAVGAVLFSSVSSRFIF